MTYVSAPTNLPGLSTPAPLTPAGFDKPHVTRAKLYHAAQVSMSSKYQGIPFRDFQKGPLDGDYGSDCSGFVASCMIEAGILEPKILNYYGTDNFREDSDMLYTQRAGYLPPRTLDNLEIGDLIFMKGGSPEATETYPGHMGIYVGNGWMSHCGSHGVETVPLLQRGDVIELKRMRAEY